MALGADNRLWAFGDNSEGQLGRDSQQECSSTPVLVQGLPDSAVVHFVIAGGQLAGCLAQSSNPVPAVLPPAIVCQGVCCSLGNCILRCTHLLAGSTVLYPRCCSWVPVAGCVPLNSLGIQALPCATAGGDHSIASVRHPKPGEQLSVGPTAACGDGLIPLQLPRMAADPQAYANFHERPEQVSPVRGSSGCLEPDTHLVPTHPASASHIAVALVQCISSSHSWLLSASYGCVQEHQILLVFPGQ